MGATLSTACTSCTNMVYGNPADEAPPNTWSHHRRKQHATPFSFFPKRKPSSSASIEKGAKGQQAPPPPDATTMTTANDVPAPRASTGGVAGADDPTTNPRDNGERERAPSSRAPLLPSGRRRSSRQDSTTSSTSRPNPLRSIRSGYKLTEQGDSTTSSTRSVAETNKVYRSRRASLQSRELIAQQELEAELSQLYNNSLANRGGEGDAAAGLTLQTDDGAQRHGQIPAPTLLPTTPMLPARHTPEDMDMASTTGAAAVAAAATTAAPPSPPTTTTTTIPSPTKQAVGARAAPTKSNRFSTIIVKVIRARNLLPKDANGLSDPYAVVTLGPLPSKLRKNPPRTHVVFKCLNPEWNYEFSYPIYVKDDTKLAPFVRVDIFDDDSVDHENGDRVRKGKRDQSGDDFLGRVDIELPLENVEDFTQWYILKQRSFRSRVAGEVLVSLKVSMADHVTAATGSLNRFPEPRPRPPVRTFVPHYRDVNADGGVVHLRPGARLVDHQTYPHEVLWEGVVHGRFWGEAVMPQYLLTVYNDFSIFRENYGLPPCQLVLKSMIREAVHRGMVLWGGERRFEVEFKLHGSLRTFVAWFLDEAAAKVFAAAMIPDPETPRGSRRHHDERQAEEEDAAAAAAADDDGQQPKQHTSNRFDATYAPVVCPSEGIRFFGTGMEYYADLCDTLLSAKETIFIADWMLSPEVQLRRDSLPFDPKYRLDNLLKLKAEEGVLIYVLVFDDKELIGLRSDRVVRVLEALHSNIYAMKHRSALLANAYYSHHQKFVVVDWRICYVGGIDLCFGRYDEPNHPVVDVVPPHIWPGADYYNPRVRAHPDLERPFSVNLNREMDPRLPWQDAQGRFEGEVAFDLGTMFTKRWSHHRMSKAKAKQSIIPVIVPPTRASRRWEPQPLVSEATAVMMAAARAAAGAADAVAVSSPVPPPLEVLSVSPPAMDDGDAPPQSSLAVTTPTVTAAEAQAHKNASLHSPIKSPSTTTLNGGGGGGPRPPSLEGAATATTATATSEGQQAPPFLPPPSPIERPPPATLQLLLSLAEWSSNPKREDSIHQAMLDMIENSRDYVYIESQFFISNASDTERTVHRQTFAEVAAAPFTKSTKQAVRTVRALGRSVRRQFDALRRPIRRSNSRDEEYDTGKTVFSMVSRYSMDADGDDGGAGHGGGAAGGGGVMGSPAGMMLRHHHHLAHDGGGGGGGSTNGGAGGLGGGGGGGGGLASPFRGAGQRRLFSDLGHKAIPQPLKDKWRKSFTRDTAHKTFILNTVARALYYRLERAITAGDKFCVVIVLPNYPEGHYAKEKYSQAVMHFAMHTVCMGPESLLGRLHDKFPSVDLSHYIRFFSLMSYGFVGMQALYENVYVHSKLMIVDDNRLLIGSANINDRSLIGQRDSEVAVLVENCVDKIRDFRMLLWSRHLGVDDCTDEVLRDPVTCFRTEWTQRSRTNTALFESVWPDMPSSRHTTFESVLKSDKGPIDPNRLARVRGFVVDQPMFFLADEVLLPNLTKKEGLIVEETMYQ